MYDERGIKITVKKSPSMSEYEIDEGTIAFIQSSTSFLGILITAEKLEIMVIVDVDNIYFMVYDQKKLINCFVGSLSNGYWYINRNRIDTWARVRNIIELFKTEDEFDINDGRWVKGGE